MLLNRHHLKYIGRFVQGWIKINSTLPSLHPSGTRRYAASVVPFVGPDNSLTPLQWMFTALRCRDITGSGLAKSFCYIIMSYIGAAHITNEVLIATLASLVTSLSENSPRFINRCLCRPFTLHSSLTPGESSFLTCTSLPTQTLKLHSPYMSVHLALVTQV